MTSWIAACILVAGFVVLTMLFRLVDKGEKAVNIARQSFGVIRSSSLSDEEKEAALQKDAKRLFQLFCMISLGGAVAVLLPIGFLWVCDRIALISMSSVLSTAFSPAFIITSSVFALLALWWSPRSAVETERYSAMERVLHQVAFKTVTAQISVADIEDIVFAKQLAECPIDRPVFITALPRAGTTLLLEYCVSGGEFASHCYRDMPFVLTPCLWNRFSATFRKTGQLQERAHGDGMLINFDSPEALEEVIWKSFWRRHYSSDRIIPWQNEDNAEFHEFFRRHMSKIILLRKGREVRTARYVSKNNLNIARVGMLQRLCPDCTVMIPFRQPLEHAASLLAQQRNFMRIHEEDPFASEYMRAIGHYDFGENLRPIDFGGWVDRLKSIQADCLAFWLEYWLVTYRHLLTENAGSLYFLSYETLCENPKRGLQLVAEAVGARGFGDTVRFASRIRAPRSRVIDTAGISESLLKESKSVYDQLRARALN